MFLATHGVLRRVGFTPPAFTDTNSFEFDGVADYLSGTTTYSELNGLDKATFSFWIKPPSTIASLQVISSVMMSASTTQRQYQIQLYTSGLIQYDSIVGGNYIRANSTALNLGQWNHVLFCIDTTQAGANRGRVFINGVDETGANTISSTLPTSTTGLFIGKQGNGQYNNFNGGLDEFAIWAGTDQRANVSEIYSASGAVDLNTLATAPNPTTWYRMGDGSTYPFINDLGSGSANLTMTNMSAANFVTDVPT